MSKDFTFPLSCGAFSYFLLSLPCRTSLKSISQNFLPSFSFLFFYYKFNHSFVLTNNIFPRLIFVLNVKCKDLTRRLCLCSFKCRIFITHYILFVFVRKIRSLSRQSYFHGRPLFLHLISFCIF